MGQILKISEAATIGIHAALIIVRQQPEPVSLPALADELDASHAHCAKVMQRLTKAGLTRPLRGPNGGYVLNVAADQLTLLDFYEAIEGTLTDTWCLFDQQHCRFDLCKCVFDPTLREVNRLIRNALDTNLADMARSTAESGPAPNAAPQTKPSAQEG